MAERCRKEPSGASREPPEIPERLGGERGGASRAAPKVSERLRGRPSGSESCRSLPKADERSARGSPKPPQAP